MRLSEVELRAETFYGRYLRASKNELLPRHSLRLIQGMQGRKDDSGGGVSRLEVVAFLLALLVVGVVGTVFVFADSSHGGDYTWRNQAAIRVLRMPVYFCGLLAVLLAGVSGYLSRRRKRERWAWRLGLFIMMTTALITVLRVHPLDSEILAWNANVPPTDWQELRERRVIWYVICLSSGIAGFVPVAIGTFFKDLKR